MSNNSRPTQVDRVLAYLKEFGFITTWDAFKELGITRLSARIFEIKERGYQVKTERINAKNKFGEAIHYLKYTLVEDQA